MRFGDSFFKFGSRTVGGALEEVLRDIIDDQIERAQRVEHASDMRLSAFGLGGIRHPFVGARLVAHGGKGLALGMLDQRGLFLGQSLNSGGMC